MITVDDGRRAWCSVLIRSVRGAIDSDPRPPFFLD